MIGVPCSGILDWKKIQNAANGPITHAVEESDQIILEAAGKKKALKGREFIVDSCRNCTRREPVGVDGLIGEIQPNEIENDDLPPTWGDKFVKKSSNN